MTATATAKSARSTRSTPAELTASERAGFAAGRVYGLLSFALSIAALILLVLNLPSALEQAPRLGWPWVGFSIAAAAAPALASLALSRRATAKLLRVIWSTSALLMFVAFATVHLALGSTRLTADEGLPWLVQLAVLAGCSAALAWPTRFAILYGLALQALLFDLVRFVNEPFPGQAMGEAVGQLFFVTFFACLAVVLRRAGLLLDQTIESAVQEAQNASVEESRRSARQRFEMLVHDRVIASLLSYASGAPPEQASSEARSALEAIESAGFATVENADRRPLALVWALQALTTQIDPEAVFQHALESELTIPAHVAEAIEQAMGEALRNSIRHAPIDRPILRQVRVEVTNSAIEVAVLDDGVGFDLGSVNPARLGIRSRIRGRMSAIAGGEAIVSSRAGYGTAVILRWARP
jgi:two-component sensor histidine kinase